MDIVVVMIEHVSLGFLLVIYLGMLLLIYFEIAVGHLRDLCCLKARIC